MLKIQYCSDLHLEFPDNKLFLEKYPIEPVGDILILAGDIVPFALLDKFDSFFDEISEKFKQVFWVPGNHEYYYSDIQNMTGSFSKKIRNNVFIVNNQVVSFQNTKLIFSTLWTSLSEINQWQIANQLSDFRVIKKNTEKFTPSDYNKLHQQSFEFLQNVIGDLKENESAVVATHHVPTFLNYPPKYKGDVLNEAFAVELFDLIESSNINFWIFGHHHSNIDPFYIGSTKLLTNQLGYVQYRENKDYSTSCYLTL